MPSKICVTCQRPFTWRKVWERCWDEVMTCSDRCKSERKRLARGERKSEHMAALRAGGDGDVVPLGEQLR